LKLNDTEMAMMKSSEAQVREVMNVLEELNKK